MIASLRGRLISAQISSCFRLGLFVPTNLKLPADLKANTRFEKALVQSLIEHKFVTRECHSKMADRAKLWADNWQVAMIGVRWLSVWFAHLIARFRLIRSVGNTAVIFSLLLLLLLWLRHSNGGTKFIIIFLKFLPDKAATSLAADRPTHKVGCEPWRR